MLGRLTFWLAVLVMTLGPEVLQKSRWRSATCSARQGGYHTYRIPGLVMTLDGTFLGGRV